MSFMYLYIFLQSNLLEVPIYHFFVGEKKQWLRSLSVVTLMNSLTHPIVFFLIMNVKNSYLQNILQAEAFAIVAETLIVYFVLRRKLFPCIIASSLANLLSWQLAPAMTYLLFRP